MYMHAYIHTYIHRHPYLYVFVYYTEHGPPMGGYEEKGKACELRFHMPSGK